MLMALIVVAAFVLGYASSACAMEEHDLADILDQFDRGGHATANAFSTGKPGYVRIEFFNLADGDTYVARVPLGTVLEPEDTSNTQMIIGTEVFVEVPADSANGPGEFTVEVPAFSTEMHESSAPDGMVMQLAPVPSSMAELEPVLQRIFAQSAQREEAAQLAVWYVTDGLDIADNPRAMELAGVRVEATPDQDDSPVGGAPADDSATDVPPGGGINDPTPSRTRSNDTAVPPGSAAVAGVVAAGLAAAAAAAGGGLSGLGSTAGGVGGGPGDAPAGTAASPQAPYQPASGRTMPPDGAAGSGVPPTAPPTPPPQQPPTAGRPDFPPPATDGAGTLEPEASVPTETEPSPTTDDIDVDRALYDPDYAGGRATPDPGMGVEVDPDSYDPWAGQRDQGREGPASVGPAPRDGDMPDITISPETGDYGVDFGGRGVRISKNRDGWNVGVGDRGVGPMDAAGVPEFDASAGGFSVSNRGGEASIGITHGGGRATTIALDKGEGLTTVKIGDQNDRTIISQVRDRYGVGRQFGSAEDPSRTVAGEYDTATGDFSVGQQDRRGTVIIDKDGDSVGAGWSSARGKPGAEDDFTRQIVVDRSTGDFDVQWGKVKVSRGDDVFVVGSGNREVSFDTDTDSGIFTFGPSDGSRQTTIGVGDGGYMASTRIPTRVGGQKIDVDVIVNRGMRWTANEDMMPELLSQGSEEYWVGIKHNWATIRTGRVGGDRQTWFTINRPLF